MQAPVDANVQHPDEREIRALSDSSGVAPARIRTLFRREHARLGMGAKVHSYLAVLTASNVRGMLRRAAQRREAVQETCTSARAAPAVSDDLRAIEPCIEGHRARRDLPHEPADTTHDVQNWEDDGGTVREARWSLRPSPP